MIAIVPNYGFQCQFVNVTVTRRYNSPCQLQVKLKWDTKNILIYLIKIHFIFTKLHIVSHIHRSFNYRYYTYKTCIWLRVFPSGNIPSVFGHGIRKTYYRSAGYFVKQIVSNVCLDISASLAQIPFPIPRTFTQLMSVFFDLGGQVSFNL